MIEEPIDDVGGSLGLPVGSPQILREVDELGMLPQAAARALHQLRCESDNVLQWISELVGKP